MLRSLVGHGSPVLSDPPGLDGIKRRYSREQRARRLLRRVSSLQDEALYVVLEWGPPMRLPEAWRLRERQPGENDEARATALDVAHGVTGLAHELTGEAWVLDGREDPEEVDRVSRRAVAEISARFPDLDPGSLRRAVSQANHTHAK